MISEKTILGVYSDSSLNSVELSLIQTDGVDLSLLKLNLPKNCQGWL